jgi:hypothetical protein
VFEHLDVPLRSLDFRFCSNPLFGQALGRGFRRILGIQRIVYTHLIRAIYFSLCQTPQQYRDGSRVATGMTKFPRLPPKTLSIIKD